MRRAKARERPPPRRAVGEALPADEILGVRLSFDKANFIRDGLPKSGHSSTHTRVTLLTWGERAHTTFTGIMVGGLPIGEPAFVTEVMRAGSGPLTSPENGCDTPLNRVF